MFTGIVEQLGNVVSVDHHDRSARITVRGAVVDGSAPGDSIAVNGICLTVVDIGDDAFSADVMRETLDRSSLGSLRAGDPVNLERAATASTRLGGHLVQGHVDGVARIASRHPRDGFDEVSIALPPDVSRYVVEKGSIAIDGVSLTVMAVAGDAVTVGLIPETLRRTTLGRRAVGDAVNVEVDVIAKYVERLVESQLERLATRRLEQS